MRVDRVAPAADLRTGREGQLRARSRARCAAACRCRSRRIDNRRSLLGVGNLADALAALLASEDAAERGRIDAVPLADAKPCRRPSWCAAIAHALRRGAAARSRSRRSRCCASRARARARRRRSSGWSDRSRSTRRAFRARFALDAAAHACAKSSRDALRAGRAAIIDAFGSHWIPMIVRPTAAAPTSCAPCASRAASPGTPRARCWSRWATRACCAR